MKLNINERKVLILSITSLIVAVVTFGVLKSTGAFEKDGYNLGGAIVGYLAALFAMNKIYGKVITTELDCLHGQWWELIQDHDQIDICHLSFNCVNDENRIYLDANAFNKNGKKVVTWKSSNAVYTSNERKLFYYWEYQNELNGIGFCHFISSKSKGKFNSGSGWYTVNSMSDFNCLNKHHVNLRRLTKEELEKWKLDKPDVTEELIKTVYKEWKDKLISEEPFKEGVSIGARL